ncbi:pentapeptide repeat-containing protein, partial [Streptomyces sp. NPDC058671]
MSETREPALRGDCANCFGLCCVALPFAKSADFAVDKPPGEPCRNLQEDFRCGIHTRLRPSGFQGCTVYDCFGAGQQVSQVTFGGVSWREAPETTSRMFDVFYVMRQLHELLRYLTEALDRPAAPPVHAARRGALDPGEARPPVSADTRG